MHIAYNIIAKLDAGVELRTLKVLDAKKWQVILPTLVQCYARQLNVDFIELTNIHILIAYGGKQDPAYRFWFFITHKTLPDTKNGAHLRVYWAFCS